MSQETNAAIATLQQVVGKHELLIRAIVSSHQFAYECMRMTENDIDFLCHYRAFSVTLNLLEHAGAELMALEPTPEMCERLESAMYHRKQQ